MPEGEVTQPTIESRRVRIEVHELRFELHQEMLNCFPEPNLFDEMEKTLKESKKVDFVGLREETVKFGLLKAIRGINKEVYGRQEDKTAVLIHKGEVNRVLFEIDSGTRLLGAEVYVTDIDTDFFLEMSEYYTPNEEIMKKKGWSEEQARRFISRVASNVFNSGLVDMTTGKIPIDIMASFYARIQNQVEVLVVDQKKVAMEYLLDGLSVEFYKSKLPEIVENSTQTEKDKMKISEVNEKPKYEQLLNTLQTVRENTEFIRMELIPACLERGDDSQTVFWKIHAGEFRGDPMAAQMLVSGTIAEVFNYVKAMSGDSFYSFSVGATRRNEVTSGGFKHVLPPYLPQLESEFFSKVDTLGETLTESEFLDVITIADISMISLHLPFDGAGRTKEDFFVYLSEKYNYPLTFSALGYRDVGSPILSERNTAIQQVKKEINKVILERLGIQSNPTTDSRAIPMIQKKFDCDHSMAYDVFHSEKALFNSQMNSAITNPDELKELTGLLPSFETLRGLWGEARNMRFFEVPEKYKPEIDGLTALISSTDDIEILGREIGAHTKAIDKIFIEEKVEPDEDHVTFLRQVKNIEAEANLDLLPKMVEDLELIYEKFEGGELDTYRYNKPFIELFDCVKKRAIGRKVFDEVFQRIDMLKRNGDGKVRLLAVLLEVYALEKVDLQKGRNNDDLLFQVFPNIRSVIENATKFGSFTTKLKAGIKLAKLRRSGPKFVEWKKPE